MKNISFAVIIITLFCIYIKSYLISPQKHWTVELFGAFIMFGELSVVNTSESADDSRWLLTLRIVDVEELSRDEIVFI